MFLVTCPMCKRDLKIPLPQPVKCRCGHAFKPTPAQIFFKVRCAHCGEVVQQPLKNVEKHAACPVCAEASLIPAPPKYKRYMEQEKARKEAEKPARKKSVKGGVSGKRKKKVPGAPVKRKKKTVVRKRHAVKKAVGQEEEEIFHECPVCGAGISNGNIEREEALEKDGQYYCWDHLPKD